MEFYRAELLMENLKEWQEKENNQRRKDEEDQKKDMPSMSSSSMMRDAGNMLKQGQSSLPSFNMPSMPGLGSLGNFKL